MEINNRKIKLVVWDLDNTMWDGVLLESENVAFGDDMRRILDTLDKRGILQSVASKNNHEQAYQKLVELGIDQYFLYPEINWNAKSASIERIVKAINIGMDAVAFVDDQPFELEEVSDSLPEVLCIPAQEIPALLRRDEMIPNFITEDSVKRREMYQSDQRRKQQEDTFIGPKESFLETLGIKFTVSPVMEEDLKRAEELTVRTHQLNTTGYTYSYDELSELKDSPDDMLLVAGMEDKFGEYGKIGLSLIHMEDDIWTLKLFLMSCRTMSTGVGSVWLNHIIALAKENNKKLRAEFLPNEKNRMMYITYKFAGFHVIHEENGVELLENDYSVIQPVPEYIQLIDMQAVH